METIIIDGEEYQQTYENGKRVWTQEKSKDGFKTKIIFGGTKESTEEFKKFVVNAVSKCL